MRQPFKHRINRIVMTALVLLALVACNGGESGTGFDPLPVPVPSAENKTIVGPITGFGSVIVNGIEFDISQALIFIDGIAGTEQDLDVGMVVTVDGQVNADGVTGVANRIDLKNELKGFVSTNNLDLNGTLVVLGQTVLVNNDTVFSSKLPAIKNLSQVNQTTYVEINGYNDGAGTVYAEYIKVVDEKNEPVTIKVQGVVATHNPPVFTINGVSIEYDMQTQFINMARNDIATGLSVVVTSSRGVVDNMLLADQVERILPDAQPPGGKVTWVGIVTQSLNDGYFKLNDKPVRLTSETVFESGRASGIIKGVKLIMQGTVGQNGTVTADSISFSGISQLTLSGKPSALDQENSEMTLFGQNISINGYTQFDSGNESMSTFRFSDITTDDYISVRVYVDETGQLIAGRVETLSQSNSEQSIYGIVADVNTNELHFDGLPALTVDVRNISDATAYLKETVQVWGSYSAATKRFVATRLSSGYSSGSDSE